jgi:tetratricopeptide (TPR) repeat protein
LFIIAFFPPSLIVWFLFFIVLSQLSTKALESSHQNLSEINLAAFPPVYLGISAVSFLFIIIGGYFLGRSYLSEYYFKKGLDGVAKNDAKQAYDNIRRAIILNPFIERYRISFSQLNLLIADGIAAKANQPQGKDKKPYQLTEQDRQNITQAIQTAISESKAAVTLNPQKALHWENLAGIYRNIIGAAQGADVWTVSAFQRAIVADPQNPIYRLNLGGIYYSLGNFEEAARLFEQAVSLKPDWANAHYNLAWADYQRQNYQRAVAEMQNAIALLNPQKDKTDLEKAQKELEEFKKKLPKEEKQATESAGSQPSKLSLPTPPTTQISPKIELPKEASPEAK